MNFHSQCFQAPSLDINFWLQNVGQFQQRTGKKTTRDQLSDSGSVRQDEQAAQLELSKLDLGIPPVSNKIIYTNPQAKVNVHRPPSLIEITKEKEKKNYLPQFDISYAALIHFWMLLLLLFSCSYIISEYYKTLGVYHVVNNEFQFSESWSLLCVAVHI